MPIANDKIWQEWVKKNKSEYGVACVDVARRAMEILDEEKGDFDAYSIIRRADKEAKAGGITGFMAGCVVGMVSRCHSRGEEFRKKWNINNQIQDEGEKANKGKGVLNPALLNIKIKE